MTASVPAACLSRRMLLTLLVGASCVAVSACRPAPRITVSDQGVPRFERFEAVYSFREPGPLLTRDFAEDPVAQADSFASDNASGVRPVSATKTSRPEWTDADLRVECPHPSGDISLARLTLILRRPVAHGDQSIEEVHLLAIPRAQVELLIADLARSGYFDPQSQGGHESRLRVWIDDSPVERDWHSDGRLLDLAYRTLTRGRPASL